jgi:sugar phosphate isomerase/epimerase
LGVDKFDDLIAFLTKYQNRIELLHVKVTTADGKITDLGQGTTNWPAVFRAAGPGVRYYIWEYDGVPDVFRSGDIAYRYLRCQK